MEHPNPAVEQGESYDQDDIEALFDTGFGYRISGINVRNDDAGDRFVLLFAREGGPYDDEVTTGEFTYIGEGLPDKGDQSTDSLGNAALIEAETDPVPIYFFYRGESDEGWVYQGLVDVAGHELIHDGDRNVLEFTMTHRDSPDQHRAGAESGGAAGVDREPDLGGRLVTETRSGVRVSEAFKETVYDRFGGRCAVTDIGRRELLTVSHVLGRAAYPDIAEDPENALLLNWTHHAAFDADLWTFDEVGRLWVHPDYQPDDEWMHGTLRGRHGERVDALRNAGVADEHIATRNQSLPWWPPS